MPGAPPPEGGTITNGGGCGCDCEGDDDCDCACGHGASSISNGICFLYRIIILAFWIFKHSNAWVVSSLGCFSNDTLDQIQNIFFKDKSGGSHNLVKNERFLHCIFIGPRSPGPIYVSGCL